MARRRVIGRAGAHRHRKLITQHGLAAKWRACEVSTTTMEASRTKIKSRSEKPMYGIVKLLLYLISVVIYAWRVKLNNKENKVYRQCFLSEISAVARLRQHHDRHRGSYEIFRVKW